ncbi:MAG TPA: hypothetical protein VMR21_08665 [Vicinamibacteria bacterium]|nr:hypothetical protein [Vicinamibacteria bacterium]
MVDWKKPPTEALHHAQADAALADQHAQEGREAAAHSPTGVAYEKLDVDPQSIVRLGITLVAASIVVSGISYGVFVFLRSREARSEPPRRPLAIREVGRVPPEPRLQTTPMSDLARLRAEQADDLERYGWVDESAGTVRIPIEEAMRIYAERQAATTTPRTPASPPVMPNDASAPYPPGASGVWPGSPGSTLPADGRGPSPPEGPPASPSPGAAPTPPPHGGHE